MTLNKIISGGQAGVDRAALDFAIDRRIPHGGWCPRGRLKDLASFDSQGDGNLDEILNRVFCSPQSTRPMQVRPSPASAPMWQGEASLGI